MRASTLLVAALFALAVALSLPARAKACERTEREWYNPTGWEGCASYGEGLASWWPGPGVATNDCLYPWASCTPITVTSLSTGRSLTVTPTMFCDCYTRTARERLVDLDPAALRALGLDPSQGLYRVRVTPVRLLPDAAMR